MNNQDNSSSSSSNPSSMLYGRARVMDQDTGEITTEYERGKTLETVVGALFGYCCAIPVGATHATAGDQSWVLTGLPPGTIIEIFDNPKYHGRPIHRVEVLLTTRLLCALA